MSKKPLSDDTRKYEWTVKFKENLEVLFADRNDVFIAANLKWYPIEGDKTTYVSPNVIIVFGRPKKDRTSYNQWEEDNIPPQVVIKISTYEDTRIDFGGDVLLYQRYGVEEYYLYEPDFKEFGIFIRMNGYLEDIEDFDHDMNGWVSPRLGIRFGLKPNASQSEALDIYYPDGRRFLSFLELDQLRQLELQEKEAAISQLQQERQHHQELLAKLASAGIDINNL